MSKKQIQTVLGPVAADSLGRTLIHEHLLVSFPGAEFDPRYLFDRKVFVDKATAKLKVLREWGIRTFVDPCPIEVGRDVRLMAEVSERAGMHIVCSTGFYYEGMGIPYYWRHASVQEIADLYIREIEQGIDGTSSRAGLIKCSTSAPITELERKVLAAACIAQRATGIPIITHTEDGLCGPGQQDIFEEHDIPLGHCLIGHSCGNPDHAYHHEIARRGSYVGFDRIGLVRRQSDEVRADNIVKLVNAGFADKVMISQDGYCEWRGKYVFETSPEGTAELDAKRAQGEWPAPQTCIFTRFIPMLKERGISDELIDMFLVENTKAYFLQDG